MNRYLLQRTRITVRLVVFSFESVMHSVETTMQQAGDLAEHLVLGLQEEIGSSGNKMAD